MGCQCSTAATEEPDQPRGALALLDGVTGDRITPAVVSFPGDYQDDWNNLVATVALMRHLATKLTLVREPHVVSTACTFLPDGDPNFGQHVPNDVDAAETAAGRCFCYKLYGTPQQWGCKWFDVWRHKLDEVLEKGQTPLVVYKAGEVGQGDKTPWGRLPIKFSRKHRGLGRSQKGEVAYLRRRLAELGRGEDAFQRMDVRGISEMVARCQFMEASLFIEHAAADVGGAFVDAFEHCVEVQQGLRAVSSWGGVSDCIGINFGWDSGVALGRSLAHLRNLRKVTIPDTRLDPQGGQAIGDSLQHLPHLEEFVLSYNVLADEGGAAIGANLWHVPQLWKLELKRTRLGEEGGKAIGQALQHLPKLEHLDLSMNRLEEEAGKAIGHAMQHLPKLQHLDLSWNGFYLEAGMAIGHALQHVPKLQYLDLSNTGLRGEAGTAIGHALQHLQKLEHLDLSGNLLEGASKALGEALRHLRGNELQEWELQFIRDGMRFTHSAELHA